MTVYAMKRPWHLWMVGLLGLAWNALGAVDYLLTETGNQAWLANFPPDQIAYFQSFPAWAVGAWALGVWGGVLGCVLLLARSRWAVWAFVASLIGCTGTTIYQATAANVPDAFRTPGAQAFNVAIWAVSVFLLIYSIRRTKRP